MKKSHLIIGGIIGIVAIGGFMWYRKRQMMAAPMMPMAQTVFS